MKKALLGLSSITAIMLVVSCFSLYPDTSTPTTTQTTFLTPNYTAVPSAVYDLNNSNEISEKCVEIVPSLDVIPDGTIVLQDEITKNISLFDLKSDKETLFEEAVPIMAVSPDYRQLAYTSEKNGQLIILASDGEKKSTIAVPTDWRGVVDWITSDTILIEKMIDKDRTFRLASSVIYTLETGEVEEYPSNYPGITTAFPPRRWGNYSYVRTVYDPLFSRVVYPGKNERGEPLLILWNLETNREVVKFHQGPDNFIGGAPQWLHNDYAFIAGIYPQQQNSEGTLYKNVSDDLPYKGGFELFHVSRDGEIRRLTYLTTKYRAGEEGFSLSPDEQYVAFWLNLNYKPGDSNADRKLAILNIETREITDLCIAGGAMPIPPIWSPDGKHLIVSRYPATGEILSDTLLVDIEYNRAIKIAENAVAQGWLAK